jgi:hypothetical protein
MAFERLQTGEALKRGRSGVRTALATGFRLCLRRSIIGLLLYVTNYPNFFPVVH